MEHHEVVVVGAGNAGVSLSARLLRDGFEDVAILDSRTVHRYRPLLNYVGTGEATMSEVERPMASVVPAGATWIPDEVASVDADARQVRTRAGRRVGYSSLVLCPGLEEDFEAVPGLQEAYAAAWAGSTFLATSAPRVWPALRTVRAGTVVFSVPPEPAPCAATALKPLLMACDHWRRVRTLQHLDVRLVLPGRSVTGLPRADARLDRVLEDYGIRVERSARVSGLDTAQRSVEVTSVSGTEVVSDVAFAHVVPHYRGASWIEEAGLARPGTGLVDVDPETLRHRRHASVWSLGDVAALDVRPSGGALREQVKVLAANLAAPQDASLPQRYDGYTVMPITVSRRRLVLVEVDRDLRAAPSAPLVDLTRPRRSTWLFDRHGLPQVYFHRILKGKV